VELIEGNNPPGIFRVLDDTCRAVHAVDTAKADYEFMEKLGKTVWEHPHFKMAEDWRAFTVKHYAGSVTYTVEDFCFKNKDNLYVSLVVGLQTTQNAFIRKLFPENVRDDKSQPTSSGKKIRDSANLLIKKLSNCHPHYVRCIKPNETRSAMSFNDSRVKHQVKYLGLAENVKVKKAGYSYRQYFHIFAARFGQLLDMPPAQDRNGCDAIINWLVHAQHKFPIGKEEFALGRTKIFIKSPETIFTMEELLEEKLYPVEYAKKVEEFKKVEKLATKHKNAQMGLSGFCSVM